MNKVNKRAILIGCDYYFCHLATLIEGLNGKYSLVDYSALSGEFVYCSDFINLIMKKDTGEPSHIELEISLNKDRKFEAYFISENEHIFIECMMRSYQKLAKLKNQYNKMQEMSLAEADEFVNNLKNYDIESFYV